MTPTEAVTIVRYIAAGCPSMRIDDATPDVWYDAGLRDIPLDVAKEAVVNLLRTQAYVGLHDLIAESGEIDHRRRGAARAAERQAELEAEGITAIDAAPPAEPNTDWRALEDQLHRRGAPTLPAPPKVDRRHDPTRLDEARRELDAARPVDPPNLSNSAPGEQQVAGSLRVKETETR